MKRILFFLLIVSVTKVIAQQKRTVLKTNGKTIKIREGKNEVHERYPNINAKPDIYVPKHFIKTQDITYLSDIDSVTFHVAPNKKYDFIIVQNNKDSIYTQINTNKNEAVSYPNYQFTSEGIEKEHTIPFEIGDDHRIYMYGKINNSDTLAFLFDTGADAFVVSTDALNKKLTIAIDGTKLNEGTDGIERVKTSSKNTVCINGLTWNDLPLLAIDFEKPPFDAIIGWVAFQNKVIKINYESKLMTIYDTLPKINSEMTKVDFRIIDGIPYIKCKMIIQGEEFEEWFDFDTGSDGTLIVSNEFASQHKLPSKMPKIGESSSFGSTGLEIKNDIFLLPRLKIGSYELYNIKLNAPHNDPEIPNKLGNIGNLILKRFTTIIDFKNNCMYLRPNNLFYSSMY